MKLDPQLERYLTALDRALGKISVSDRSDIITEIKSHVIEAQTREPQSSLREILAALGEPENVANRYLMERGIKPGKPSKTPVIKWLTIGFLGTIGIAAFTVVMILWRFTPVLKVDEKTGQVIILGGLIEVNESKKSDSSDNKNRKNTINFDGETKIDASKISAISVNFANGEFDFSKSTDGQLHWSCAISGGNPTAKEDAHTQSFTFNFNSSDANCDLEIPAGLSLIVRGANGEVELDHPQSKVDIKLENGQINVAPDSAKNYKYEASVINGSSAGAVSSNSPDAILLKLAVSNGNIEIQ